VRLEWDIKRRRFDDAMEGLLTINDFFLVNALLGLLYRGLILFFIVLILAFSCFYDELISESLLDFGENSPGALPNEEENVDCNYGSC
jgi:hypothetical protein